MLKHNDFKWFVDRYHQTRQERINYPLEALKDLITLEENKIQECQADIQAMRDLIPLVKE